MDLRKASYRSAPKHATSPVDAISDEQTILRDGAWLFGLNLPHDATTAELAAMVTLALLRPATDHQQSAEARAGIGALAVLLTAAMLTLTVSNLLAAVYLLGIATISGLGPWLLVSQQHAQKDAVRISGPWDSAVRAFLLTQAEGRRGARDWDWRTRSSMLPCIRCSSLNRIERHTSSLKIVRRRVS